MESGSRLETSGIFGLLGGADAERTLNRSGHIMGFRSFDEAVLLANMTDWRTDLAIQPPRDTIYFLHEDGYFALARNLDGGLNGLGERIRLTRYTDEGRVMATFIEKARTHPRTAGFLSTDPASYRAIAANQNFDEQLAKKYGIGIDRRFTAA